ncbi:BZ3500_MvSof-1268-A1-R1_Chr3-1g05468 [Microbotryum saponariae]|uniref:BZ3500_MvSof-1268-A1-R1_Chr3-1g05468 protein n=1 Tax=Microbotryum saponariae TaxID=289078 RepID=A0A2X0KZM9_9BASI|nr:BZ3500_MvSof-1268-A1-R1_Chr3-1g05468 [Microbotryum saponariae]SDA04659.1 BZ3501_MvSof-1269-A2-R1_Chr3-1g05139 [Microbotryum saponariae]
MAATSPLRRRSATISDTTSATATSTTLAAPTTKHPPDHSLATWLADVGAADLSPALVWPPPGAAGAPSTAASSARRASLGAPPPLMALQRRIQHEIAQVNNQTRELLEHHWGPFQEQVADGKELLARIEEQELELGALQQQLDGEDAFLPGLIEQLTSHSKLAQAHQLNLYTIQLVTTLLELHTAVAALSDLITHGALPSAVPALRALRSHVSRGVEPWIASTEAYIVLRRWSLDEQVRLEGALAGSLEACFEFLSPSTTEADPTTTTTNTAWTLNLRNAISAAPKGDHIAVEELWAALEHVYAMGREGEPIKRTVDTHLTRIAKQTIKYIVAPYLESNGAGKRKTEIIYSEVGELDGAITISLQPVVDGQEEVPSVEECLKDLGAFLAFFGQHASLLPPSPYASTFTQHLTPTLQSLVVSSHLLPSLPSSSDHLESYLSILDAARTFEADFLDSNGYFSFLPSTAGPEVEERRVIREWIERVDRHWAKFVGDQALVDARKAIVGDEEWEGAKRDVEVQVDEGPVEAGGVPPTRIEQYLVSKRCEAILQVARRILDEAVKVASPSFPFPTFANSSNLLLKAFVSILTLYRATAPVHHHSKLSSSSALTLQFSNDLDYIATQIASTWTQIESSFTPEQSKDVQQAIAATRRMSKEMQDRWVMKKKEELMDHLDEAGAFLYTADDAVYKACEEAVRKVMDELRSVVEEWKPVTNPTFLYTTLGSLVNDVLLRVLDEIEGQLDISEEESTRLNKLCKMLHGLEDLFDEGVTSVGREVPVWFKFVFLSELLEASMADILFLFDNGHLVDFEPSAIAKLVRALFSDSPLRNRNLEHILNGHPTNVPNDDDETTTTDGGYSRPSTPPSGSSRSRNVIMGSGSAGLGSPARRGGAFNSTPNRVQPSAREASPPASPVTAPPVVRSGKISLGAARISRPEPLLPPSPPSASTEAWGFDEEDETKDEIVVPPPEPEVLEDAKPPVIDPGLDASFDTHVVIPEVKKEELVSSIKTEEKVVDDPWGLLDDDEPVVKPVAKPTVVEDKPKPVVQIAPPRTSRLGAKRVPVPVQQRVLKPASPTVVAASPPPAAPKPKIALAPARPITVASPPRVLASRAVVSPPPKAMPAAARVLSPTPSSSSSSGGVPPPPRASSAFSAASGSRAGASPRIRAGTISPIQSPGRSTSPSARTASPAFSSRGVISPPPPPFASRGVVSPPPQMRGSPALSGMSSPPSQPIGRGSPSPSPSPSMHELASPPLRGFASPPPPPPSNRNVISPPPLRSVVSPPPMRNVVSPPSMPQPLRRSGVISPQQSTPISSFSPPPTVVPVTQPVQPPTTLARSSPSPKIFSPPLPTLKFSREEEETEPQPEDEEGSGAVETTSLGRPRTGSYSSASGARTGGILGSGSVSGGEDDWGIELELENGPSSPLPEEAQPAELAPEPEVEPTDEQAVDEEESIVLEVERVALSEEESIGFPSPIPSNASLFDDHDRQRPRRGSILINPVFSTQGFVASDPMPTAILDDLESAVATTTSLDEAEAARAAAEASTTTTSMPPSTFTSPQTPLAAPPMTAQHSKHHSDPFEFDQLVASSLTVAAVPKVLSYSPPPSMRNVLARERDEATEPERVREETQPEVEEEEIGWSFDQSESGGASFEHDATSAENSIVVHDESMEQVPDHDLEDEEEGWPIDDTPLGIDEEADLEAQTPQEPIEHGPTHFEEQSEVRAFSSSTESPILVSPPTSSNASQHPSIVEVEYPQPAVEEVFEPESEVEQEEEEERVEPEPEPEVEEPESKDEPVQEEDEMDQVIEDDGWGFSDNLSIPSPTQEHIFSPPSPPQSSPSPASPAAAAPAPVPVAAPSRMFAPPPLSRLAMKNLNLSSTSALSPTIRSPLPAETAPPPAPLVPSTSHMPTALYSPLPTAHRPDIVAHMGHAIPRQLTGTGKYDIFPPTPTNERSSLSREEEGGAAAAAAAEEEEEDGGWGFDDSAAELGIDTSANDEESYFSRAPRPIIEDGVVKMGLMQPVVGRAQEEVEEDLEGGLEGDELDEDGWGF